MNSQSPSSANNHDKIFRWLGVANLIVCCVFTILGIVSTILLHTNNYRLFGDFYEYSGTGEGSVYFSLGYFLPLLLSFFVCTISSVVACLCLSKIGKPKINISTLAVTAFNLLFCIISFLIYLA